MPFATNGQQSSSRPEERELGTMPGSLIAKEGGGSADQAGNEAVSVKNRGVAGGRLRAARRTALCRRGGVARQAQRLPPRLAAPVYRRR
jgi:hypothetical protein